jgi:hypothetical protein
LRVDLWSIEYPGSTHTKVEEDFGHPYANFNEFCRHGGLDEAKIYAEYEKIDRHGRVEETKLYAEYEEIGLHGLKN